MPHEPIRLVEFRKESLVITPTKTIAPQQALLSVGAQLLPAGEHQPLTVTQAWVRLQDR